MKTIILFLALCSISINPLGSQSETCKFVGEISLVSVSAGAFWTCTYTGNPASCSIALAAHTCGKDPACNGVVKTLVEKGCKYTVEVVDDKIKIVGEATKEKMFDLQSTWEYLNRVEGIVWLQKLLEGG